MTRSGTGDGACCWRGPNFAGSVGSSLTAGCDDGVTPRATTTARTAVVAATAADRLDKCENMGPPGYGKPFAGRAASVYRPGVGPPLILPRRGRHEPPEPPLV